MSGLDAPIFFREKMSRRAKTNQEILMDQNDYPNHSRFFWSVRREASQIWSQTFSQACSSILSRVRCIKKTVRIINYSSLMKVWWVGWKYVVEKLRFDQYFIYFHMESGFP